MAAVAEPELPPAFVARMRDLLGAEAEELFAALHEPPAVGLRVNARKAEPERVATALPWPLRAVPWCATGFVVEDDAARPGRHPWHLAGVFYLQDPSAMAVAEAVDARPGMWVADLAAAPGGKATRLAELVGSEGLLLANDVHPVRAVALGQNLERWGADNTVLSRAEIADLADAWGPVFDRVLLDAPCSGEGMFRKSPEARAMWSESTVAACAARQDDLLAEAVRMVAPGGKLIYSTCTFAPEEDEARVAGLLRAHPGASLEPTGLPGVGPGRPEWVQGDAPAELARAARLWPHRHDGEGHFLAVVRFPGDPGDPGEVRGSARRRSAADALEGRSRDLLAAFRADTLHEAPWAGRALVRVEAEVYARPVGAPDVHAGSLVRPGLWLGTLKKKRFEPSHALALSVAPELAQRRLELRSDDPELVAYLTGLELGSDGDDGWLLVCVDGFPLGWGRRVRGVVRNAYPRGLRLR